MRAVNLIPEGSGRSSGRMPAVQLSPGHAALVALAAVLGLVTVYVLSGNSVADNRVHLAALQQQLSQAQAQAQALDPYVKFAKLEQARVSTVRQLAGSRFNWYAALSDLSRVFPAGAALQSLTATVAPGASVSGAGGTAGGGTSALRGAITSPAFELHGCAASHDEVASLMSRLRVMNGVQRVTLADSVKAAASAPGAGTATGSAAAVCGPQPASFDLVVFFQPLPGSASSTGSASAAAPASSSSTTTTTTSSTSSSASSGTSGQGTSGPKATSASQSSQAVSTGASR